MDKSKTRKYFSRKKPYGAVFLIIFSFMPFLLGIFLEGGYMWIIIGFILDGLGVFIIASYYKNYSDETIDAFCEELFQESLKESKDILLNNGVNAPYVYSSYKYCFENIFSQRRAIKCRDGKYRSSILKIEIFYISQQDCYYFLKQISLISDEVLSKSKIIQNKDIQMVSLEEFNQSFAVAIAIPGNEKICVTCKNREDAIKLCDKLKSKIQIKKKI